MSITFFYLFVYFFVVLSSLHDEHYSFSSTLLFKRNILQPIFIPSAPSLWKTRTGALSQKTFDSLTSSAAIFNSYLMHLWTCLFFLTFLKFLTKHSVVIRVIPERHSFMSSWSSSCDRASFASEELVPKIEKSFCSLFND